MKNRLKVLLLLILVGTFTVLFLAACNQAKTPITSEKKEASGLEALANSEQFVTYDDLLVEVSEQLSGFGGFFFDEAGNLKVYLKGAAELGSKHYVLQAAQAREAITAVFGEQLIEDGAGPIRTEDGEVLPSKPVEIVLLEGQYDVAELSAWRKHANDLLAVPGVLFTDMDEMINRIAIGVEESMSQDQVRHDLLAKDIPLEAVVIEVDEPIELAQSQDLQDDVEPNMGGLQISTFNGKNCTLGFIAHRGSTKGLVTNSHCTTIQGGSEATQFSQPFFLLPIGVEIDDPHYFTNVQYPWSACPTGHYCRYSDSALVEIQAPATHSLGDIARPISWNQGDLDINDSNPVLSIVAEQSWPTAGQYLDKIGRSTGWTYGRLDRSCFDRSLGNITMICQYQVSRTYGSHTMASHGDSGSPVFFWRGNDVDLAGIVWSVVGSGKFVFSAFPMIEAELGVLTTY